MERATRGGGVDGGIQQPKARRTEANEKTRDASVVVEGGDGCDGRGVEEEMVVEGRKERGTKG